MKSTDLQEIYRAIPSVHELLQNPAISKFPIHPRYIKQIIQEEIDAFREIIPRHKSLSPQKIPEQLQEKISVRLGNLLQPQLKRVVNATGIILHTNLGRAALSEASRRALQEASKNYCNLEIKLESGKRGNRNDHIEELLCLITGAEAALMVNNCAAAIFLALNTLCNRREVPVSRGELVEIGGSFRMPEVMKSSGAKMVEIGTTNKTHLKDYQQAITRKTGALLKVHASNFRILGFTGQADIPELARLAQQNNLPFIYDMGSGVLEDLRQWDYPYEPLAREVLDMGVDVLTFSGDKVLGGPQAGIIVGTPKYIQKIKENHLTRALRCDKLIFAAMEATLRAYLQPEKLPESIPVYSLLKCPQTELKRRAESIQARCKGDGIQMAIVETFSQMGSGALPLEKIPSVALKITSQRLSPIKLADKMRSHHPPVVGYVQEDALFLNFRTIREDELDIIVEALNTCL